MPSKLENITNLYKETLSDISGSSENWTSFLISASNNYKYNFAEQILIFSQRPEATACADIDTWNKQVKRWVNKGAKGIALLSEVNGRCVLRHVFDVSDTHNYYGTKLNLWKIENKYENEIIESLEAKFGTLENKTNLAQAIISSSYNSVEDNLQDYLSDLINSKNDSLLEEFDDFGIEVKFRRLLSNSVTFMTLTRCGINPFDYFEMDDFIDIYDFNTIDNISRLGVATSDIAETNLREIHNTINKLKINEKNQIYTFVKNQNVKDNIEKESERSVDYANNIQESRGLPNTESNDRKSKRESISRQVLSNEVKLSEGKQKRTIHSINNEKQINRTFTRNTRNSDKENRTNNKTINDSREYNRRDETTRPNEVASNNEQFEEFSRGNSSTGTNLQLDLPSEIEQKQRIAEMSENDVTAIFNFTQEMIDRTLQSGSGFARGKFRIYKQMTSSLSSKENIDFLKHEYGIGGASSAYIGADFGQEHNAKGIKLYKGFNDDRPEKLLSWRYVEKRIKDLILSDRYLNDKEFDEYLLWLDNDTKEKIDNKKEIPVEKVLDYHLGDTVYIGADQYEITNIGLFDIELYDVRYPLFGRAMPKEEFETKVKENPCNSHLFKIQEVSQNNELENSLNEKLLKLENEKETYKANSENPNIERINYKITDDNLGVGTPKERFNNNIEAIKVLKKCENENRLATKEEQNILSKYVGWGGLSNAFNIEDSNWTNEYNTLKDLLTEEEYENARASTLTAFYTPPIVIKAMYKVLENIGVKNANILEPSCGIGNFIGSVPSTINNKIYGIELDSISGRIARQLYQKENITINGFEKVDLPDSFFDIAIGNVPFGNFKVNDKKYDKNNFLIHDYFFGKTLDKVRPGGVVAFITSKGTLDKENPNVRKYIAQRADLLGKAEIQCQFCNKRYNFNKEELEEILIRTKK